MKYGNIENKDHMTNFINFLIYEVGSAGGDGDGLWYSVFYKVDDIIKFIQENKLMPDHWVIQKVDDLTYNIGEYQEWLTITNDESVYNNAPSWQQILIKW